MEEAHNSLISSHNGLSYSTIIIFGTFIFLLLMAFISYQGRITEVLKKTAFFSMMMLYIQSALGFSVAFSSPEFANLQSVGDYLEHFEYAFLILVAGGLMTFVQWSIKNSQNLKLVTVVVALSAALIFEYAYPWSKILGI